MSILRKYARPKTSDPKKRTLSVRIPESLYDEFKAECERNGYSMAEGIRLLLELDLRGELSQGSENKEIPQAGTIQQRSKRQQRPAGVGGRFTVAPWEIKGRVPCPICGTWYSKQNIARHARGHHDMTTRELYEKHKEKADAMTAAARSEGGESE